MEVGSTAHYAMNYTIDNVSVREMPVIKWAPHNLLTYSEDLSNAAWNLSGSTREVVSSASPIGTDAYKIIGNTVNTEHKFFQNLPSTYSHSMTVAVFAKADGYNFFAFRNQTNSAWGNTNINFCLLYTSPSPRDGLLSRMPSSA